jgi:hypothetical protein
VIRQQFSHIPPMSGDPGGHCRCRRPPAAAKTRVRSTKIIDRADQIHSVLESQWAPRQRPPSPCKRCQPFAECGIEPLDVGRVEHPVAVRAVPERLDAGGCAIHDAALNVNYSPLGIPFHDLRKAEVAPATQPRAPLPTCLHGITKGLANRPYIGAQAVCTKQEWAVGRTTAHPPHKTKKHGDVAPAQ